MVRRLIYPTSYSRNRTRKIVVHWNVPTRTPISAPRRTCSSTTIPNVMSCALSVNWGSGLRGQGRVTSGRSAARTLNWFPRLTTEEFGSFLDCREFLAASTGFDFFVTSIQEPYRRFSWAGGEVVGDWF
nr:hypothetical protein Iba_chr01eCG1160 [Ipomoea batatas]